MVQEMENQMVKLKTLLKTEIPMFLYHYTDKNALKGIIKNNEMWATHIRFMNDYEEQRLAFELLEEQIPDLLKDKGIDCKKLLNQLHSDVKKETLKKGVYIISFSEKRDNLGQWRGYGNKIPSFCIGLNKADFTKCFVSEPNPIISKRFNLPKVVDILNESENIDDSIFHFRDDHGINRKIFFVPCIYNEQVKYIDELISDSFNYLRNLGEKPSVRNLSKEIAARFVIYSSFIKDIHFKEESEWRIVIIYEKTICNDIDSKIESEQEEIENSSDEYKKDKLDNDLDVLESIKGKIKYDSKVLSSRNSKYGDKPFIKFQFPSKCFSEFIVGPGPDKTIVEDWLWKFLYDNGFDIDGKNELVRLSEIPYRNWI